MYDEIGSLKECSKPVEQLLQPRSSEEVQGQEGDEASWFRLSIWLVAKPHSSTNVRQGTCFLFLLAFYTEDPQDIHAKCTKCTTLRSVNCSPLIKESRTKIHNIIFKSFKNSKRYAVNIYFTMYAIYILQCMQYTFCNVCKIYFAGPTTNSSSHLNRQRVAGVRSHGAVKDRLHLGSQIPN